MISFDYAVAERQANPINFNQITSLNTSKITARTSRAGLPQQLRCTDIRDGGFVETIREYNTIN